MNVKTPTLLSYAFRPFFLLNGFFAIIVVALWVMSLHGSGPPTFPAIAVYWHGHEMLVGFAMAAVAGFLLTAVANWTGRPALSGAPLGWLVMTWLTGRIAMLLSGVLPAFLVMLLDGAFPVLLCVFASREVMGSGNRRNYPVAAITGFMAILNLVFHFGAIQADAGVQRLALYLLIHLVLVLVTVIAGRIVPSFTANWLRARGETRLPSINARLDIVTIVATLAAGVAVSLSQTGPVTGVLALIAAATHVIRLSRWHGFSTTPEPLLFVLHVNYLWLPVGYFLMACAAFGWWFMPTAALHALTMGAIGGMILAVTTRVALGHTGRPLHAARLTVVAYLVLMIASLLRVFGPQLGNQTLLIIDLSAAAWMLAFGLFSWVYWPMLTKARVSS
jgi:uncharacterized protein involved in response to NO